MPIFVYKAKKGPQETIEGEIEAENRDTAVLRLSDSGLVPVSIELKVTKSKEVKRRARLVVPRKLGLKELNVLTQQLRTLIRARVELLASLSILHKQADNPALKEIILDLRNTVKDGKTFSEGLSKYPKFFPSLYVNIIKAGETSGRLDESLSELSEFLEKEQDFRIKVRSALAYPMLMIIVGIGTIFVLFSFIIPRLLGIFSDFQGTLPLPTRILLAASNFMHRFWVFILAIVILIILYFQKQRTSKGAGLDAIKIRLPILGELTRKQSITRFCHTLSLLLHSGIPVFQSLSIAIPTLENKIYIKQLEDVHKDVLAGSTLADSFRKTTFIPPFIIQMITVGEEGGRLEEVLNEIVSSYTRETDTILKIITSLIEPLVILSLGIILGLIIIAILLPVFQINMLIK
jgi:type II secretory pathway component PulF